jgi:hypothetical protein
LDFPQWNFNPWNLQCKNRSPHDLNLLRDLDKDSEVLARMNNLWMFYFLFRKTQLSATLSSALFLLPNQFDLDPF